MRYSIVKIFLFLFSYSFFAANLPPEAQKALRAIEKAILEHTVLYVENPGSMPDRDNIKNNDVISFKKELHDTLQATNYLNKYIHKDSNLLLNKAKTFKTNNKLKNLTKFLSRNSNGSRGSNNKQYSLKIWSCLDDTNMYYYFEKIHPNTVKEPLGQLQTIEEEPPKKKIKGSLMPLEPLEMDSLIEEIIANPMATFTKLPISANTQQNFFIPNPTCFQPIIINQINVFNSPQNIINFNQQKPVIEQDTLTPKKEAIAIIEKIDPYFYKDLTYIDFFNYEYNKIYLAGKLSFCKIEESDVTINYSLYNFEMFKFKLVEENSAWYIKMINNLTYEIKEFICIYNKIN